MVSKCKKGECNVVIDESITEVKKEWEKRFAFPKLWLSVLAKSLEEAEEKIKMITEYKNKSI